MPEQFTKKQIMQHLKTPYTLLEIGGEEFTANNQHRHNWGFGVWYDYLSIEANPLANAWRVKNYDGCRLVTKRADVIQIASDYIELNRLTWDCWELSQGKEQYPRCKRPKSWTDMQSLLKNGSNYGLQYKDGLDDDVSFYIGRFNFENWTIRAGNTSECVTLYRLGDVMKNIRIFSNAYKLSASDWYYEG